MFSAQMSIAGFDPDLAKAIAGFLSGDWSDTLTPDRLQSFVKQHYSWDRHVDAVAIGKIGKKFVHHKMTIKILKLWPRRERLGRERHPFRSLKRIDKNTRFVVK